LGRNEKKDGKKKTITKSLTKIIIKTGYQTGGIRPLHDTSFIFFGQQMEGTIYARAEIGSMATNPAQTEKMADQCFCAK